MDLDADKREFVDVVISPLEGSGAQRQLLEEVLRLASGMPTSLTPDTLPVATVRIRSTASTSKIRSVAPRFATMLVLTLSLGFLFSPSTFQSLWRVRMATDSFEKFIPNELKELLIGEPDDEDTRSWILSRIAPDQRLVAMGNVDEIDDSRRWEAVWKAHPEDPAHFYAYVLAYRGSWYKWPENWVATGEKLDPDNGWFALIDACSRIGDSIEPATKASRKGWGSKAVVTPAKPARVKDQAALEAILAEIDHALALPTWNNFRLRLSKLRMSAWPPPVDYPEQLLSLHFRRESPESGTLDLAQLPHLRLLFEGASLHFANTGNRPELDALAARYLEIFRTMAKQDQIDLTQWLFALNAMDAAKGIEAAYSAIGDPVEAAKFRDFRDAGSRISAAKRSLPASPVTLEQGSSIAQYWGIGPSANMISLAEHELRGGRLAEYAMAERVLMHALVGFLCLVLFLLLFSAHYPKREMRRLADRLLQLLSYRDWLWIIGLGTLLPVTLYVMLQRLPWLGFRSRTMDSGEIFLTMLQLAGLALCFVLCTVETTRWRLAKRAWVLGFGLRFFDAGPAFALSALCSMPFLSAVPKIDEMPGMDHDWMEAAIATALGLPSLWALAILVACYLKHSPRRLHRLILLRACTPVLAFALALSLLSIFAIHAEEKMWTADIEFESVTNKEHYATGSRAGFEHAKWIHEELKAIFGPLPR